jgi:hypothetical protein
VGRQITAILWEDLEGQALPVFLLNSWDRDGNADHDGPTGPEGNGSSHKYDPSSHGSPD